MYMYMRVCVCECERVCIQGLEDRRVTAPQTFIFLVLSIFGRDSYRPGKLDAVPFPKNSEPSMITRV